MAINEHTNISETRIEYWKLLHWHHVSPMYCRAIINTKWGQHIHKSVLICPLPTHIRKKSEKVKQLSKIGNRFPCKFFCSVFCQCLIVHETKIKDRRMIWELHTSFCDSSLQTLAFIFRHLKLIITIPTCECNRFKVWGKLVRISISINNSMTTTCICLLNQICSLNVYMPRRLNEDIGVWYMQIWNQLLWTVLVILSERWWC